MNNFLRPSSMSDLQCLQQGLPQCWQQTTVASLQAANQKSDDLFRGAMGSDRPLVLGLYDGFAVALVLGCSGLVSLLQYYQRSSRHQRQVARLERVWRL